MDQKLIIIAACSAALAATPAHAAPVSNSDGTARVRILEPLAIFKVDDLDFGTVVISPTQSGSVTMPSNGNARSFSGGATGVPGDPGNRAHFTVVGNPGQQIILTHSTPVTLTNAAGDSILVLGMWMNGLPLRTLSPVDGREQVYLGGSLLLNADQPEGLYEASFTVTVDYR